MKYFVGLFRAGKNRKGLGDRFFRPRTLIGLRRAVRVPVPSERFFKLIGRVAKRSN
jgi:hypothetical protein